MKLNIYETNTPNIDVKNVGVLEVPEGKNVDDLPIYHFVDIAKKRGLSTVTRALNNLQVWNKNKDPKLSKWARDMIDKVTKRFENQKNESISRYSDVVPYEDRKYWYFTTHGLGPGMLPKGVNVLKTQEGQNKQGTWGDFICLDAILNTSELRQYDLIELAPDTIEECDSMTEYLSADTEEQELAEFLDWLKDENIPVTKVAKGVKTIYLQNDKDLDEASFYLQDRDYFKKLYDFGWHVAVLNKSLGRKLAGTLKMESPMKENSGNYGVEIDDSITYNDAKNEMHLMPRYFVMLKKYPKLGNNAYMLKYVDEYSDKSNYCFCTRNGEPIDKDNRGLPVYNAFYADKILPKIFPKNFKPDVLYAVWTDGPFDVQFATVSPMWGHISNYFK